MDGKEFSAGTSKNIGHYGGKRLVPQRRGDCIPAVTDLTPIIYTKVFMLHADNLAESEQLIL